MRQFILALITIGLLPTIQAAEKPNIDSLYQVLDAAIDSSTIYRKQKQQVISRYQTLLDNARSDADRYQCAFNLYREYSAFVNDSALKYAQECIDIADRTGRTDQKTQAEVSMAYQLANTGFYPEAQLHFDAVPKEALTSDLELTYLSGLNHLYGEMGYYSHDPRLGEQFHARSRAIRDSLLTLYPQDSRSYNALMSMVLNNRNEPEEALPYSDKWLAAISPGTRAFAIMAFFRSEIYKRLGDTDMQRYWLLQSAITDVRLAINDQAALWSLADAIMAEEGDLDRAYRYMDYSWGCISQFSTHMRSWVVTPILTLINDKYKEQLHTSNVRLSWTLAIISLLSIGLLALLLYVQKKRRQLAEARTRLEKGNEQLSALNTQLQAMNQQLTEANIHLKDVNRVKQEYITKFLQLCSDYIDKLDNYRIKINRKVKAGQYDDIRKLTGSTKMKEEEVQSLFDNFDTVFMHLFPTFLDEFNALLRPDEQVSLTDDGHLPTDVRIFALIRLGISESSRIADFLRYSPNSIYNYRARIKNKALGNRDELEDKVMEIGLE